MKRTGNLRYTVPLDAHSGLNNWDLPMKHYACILPVRGNNPVLRRRSKLIQTFICIALLFVVPVVVSAPAIKQGDLPMDMSGLTTQSPWQEARSDGAIVAGDETSTPFIDRYYPWYAFINDSGTNKEMPLWNPYESFGAPFLALWRTRALSPFSLPIYFLPLHTGIGMAVFLKLLIAGLAAYYAARRFHFSPFYSILPALTFQMSGIFLVGHWHPASDVLPWFPLVLPSLQRLLLGEYRIWPSVALLIGAMTLGGDPETIAVILLFLIILTVVYGLRTYTIKHLAGALITLIFAILLGLTLAALQLIPYIEFLRYGDILDSSSNTSLHLADLAMLFAPITTPANITVATWLPAGIIGFLLIPLWLAVRPSANRIQKRRLESFVLATIVISSLSVFTPLFRIIPGLSHFSCWHFFTPFSLACGFLATASAAEWVHLDAESCKQALKKLIWLIPVFWGVAFLGVFLLISRTAPPQPLPQSFLFTGIGTVIVLFLLLLTAFWPQEKLLLFCLILITATLSWLIYMPTSLITQNQDVFPETHFISTLRGLDSRAAGTTRLQDWPLSPHHIPQTYSPSGIRLERNQDFMKQTEEHPQLLRLSGAQALLLTKEDIQERYASLRPMLNIQEVFPSGAILLRDLQTKKRVYITHTGRSLDDNSDASQLLRVSGPPLLEGSVLPESLSEPATGTCTITEESFNTLQVETTSDRPGVLIINDSWFPGWHAEIDGQLATVFPVNIAFRGTEISEGKHDISFRYAPLSWQLGKYLSLAALGIVLFGYVIQYRNRRRI